MIDVKAYNDAEAQRMVARFRERIAPLMADVAPDWLLHHIELRRVNNRDTYQEQVEIRLVIRPIGEAREVPTMRSIEGWAPLP